MIVIDSSSLILLAKLSIMDRVINNLKEKATITSTILTECTAKKDAFDSKLIEKRVIEKKIRIKEVKKREWTIQKDFNLGKGEAEAVALCQENNCPLITDDRKAINTCKVLRINFTTVPNILLEIHKKGLINKEEAKAYIKRLKEIGRYTSETLKKVEEDIEDAKNE